MVYYTNGDNSGMKNVVTSDEMRGKFVLNEDEILKIANWGIVLERYYNSPVSIEWAKDSQSDDLYLLQAKPENFKK
jgi:pyruvate,water dikinase